MHTFYLEKKNTQHKIDESHYKSEGKNEKKIMWHVT